MNKVWGAGSNKDWAVCVGIQQRPPGLCWAKTITTASGGDSANPDVITFDILDDSVVLESNALTEKLTQEEKEEICRVIGEFEGANSAELVDFTSQEFASVTPHHKSVTPEELDRLAGNNSSENTTYQMKWAVTVMKGIISYI